MAHCLRIENVVAALNGEIHFHRRPNLLEAHRAPIGSGQLRLNMCVGEKDEVERAGPMGGLGKTASRHGKRSGSQCAGGKKISTVHRSLERVVHWSLSLGTLLVAESRIRCRVSLSLNLSDGRTFRKYAPLSKLSPACEHRFA